MENVLQTALKEWATVVRALSTGQQIILFRKGGIIEQHDQFALETPNFLLFPTLLHQDPSRLKPAYQAWVAETEAERPDPKQIPIQYWAQTTEILEAKNIERLQTLPEAVTVWNPEHVIKTWSWAPEKPAYILFLRVYALPQTIWIPDQPAYSGCVSWIDLAEPIALDQSQPVLTDEAYAHQKAQLMALLSSSAHPIAF